MLTRKHDRAMTGSRLIPGAAAAWRVGLGPCTTARGAMPQHGPSVGVDCLHSKHAVCQKPQSSLEQQHAALDVVMLRKQTKRL